MADELTRITILRSSNAAKLQVRHASSNAQIITHMVTLTLPFSQLNVSLEHTTLADIKNKIADEFSALLDCIGTTPSQQRIFHLGRELKSGGRTLEKLGLGRYRNNTTLHLHVSTRMPSSQAQQSTTTNTDSSTDDVVVVLPSRPMSNTRASLSSSLSSSSSSAAPRTGATRGNRGSTASTSTTTTTTQKQVIDLLDDEDSNDDEDDAVIVDPPSSSPKTKRQRV